MISDRSIITVLVVEDEALTRLDLVETLRGGGYEVLEASDAREAFGYQQSGQRVDVVITDIQLGGGPTGWDVAERFRAARSDIPSCTRPAMPSMRLERSPAASFSASPAGRSIF